MTKLPLILLTLFVVAVPVLAFYHADLSFFDMAAADSILTVLLTIASIVFAIVGAWIAIVYPAAVRKFYAGNPDELKANGTDEGQNTFQQIGARQDEMDELADNLLELITIVIVSSVVLIFTLLVKVLHPIIVGFMYFGIPIDVVKSIAIFFILSLSSLQIWAIYKVSNKNYQFYLRVKKKHDEQKRKMHGF